MVAVVQAPSKRCVPSVLAPSLLLLVHTTLFSGTAGSNGHRTPAYGQASVERFLSLSLIVKAMARFTSCLAPTTVREAQHWSYCQRQSCGWVGTTLRVAFVPMLRPLERNRGLTYPVPGVGYPDVCSRLLQRPFRFVWSFRYPTPKPLCSKGFRRSQPNGYLYSLRRVVAGRFYGTAKPCVRWQGALLHKQEPGAMQSLTLQHLVATPQRRYVSQRRFHPCAWGTVGVHRIFTGYLTGMR